MNTRGEFDVSGHDDAQLGKTEEQSDFLRWWSVKMWKGKGLDGRQNPQQGSVKVRTGGQLKQAFL
jgi:hypothetical protein